MKLRTLTIFAFALILLAPLSARAERCCYREGGQVVSGAGGASVTPDLCSVKTATCVSGQTEIDCNAQSACWSQVPSCCIYSYGPGSDIKNKCIEHKESSFPCVTELPGGTTWTVEHSTCSALPDATCPRGDILAPEPPAASAPPPAKYPIIVPKIPLNIPTVNLQDFINVKQEEGYLYIPFISVFLVGAYKLGVGIAAILAVIMIMIGGFIWIAAAGDSGKIGKAKAMISSAVVGLLLTFGSYVTLQLVNPDLVNFSALKIPIVGMQMVEIAEDYNPEIDTGAAPVGGAPSQYDDIFAKYAPCAGITPEALKAIAMAESGLNASKKNASGYIGLFQTKAANCPSRVAGYCTDLTNPDNNTAVGAAMISRSVSWIAGNCPNASPHDQMVMIYVAHNMGYGMLQRITQNGGCTVSTMRQAAINAYATFWPGTASSYSQKYQKGCLDSGKTAAECTGGPKFDYAVRIADKYGASQVLAPNSGKCPY